MPHWQSGLVVLSGRFPGTCTLQDKGGQEPARWMPPNNAIHCQHAMQFIAVLLEYGLAVDGPSVPVLRKVIATCLTG